MTASEHDSFFDIILSLRPLNPDLDACWDLVARGSEYHMLDQQILEELVISLQQGHDYMNEELGFEFVGGKLRISLLDEKVYCDPDSMISQLVNLRHRCQDTQE